MFKTFLDEWAAKLDAIMPKEAPPVPYEFTGDLANRVMDEYEIVALFDEGRV